MYRWAASKSDFTCSIEETSVSRGRPKVGAMSKEDLWRALGRTLVDPEYADMVRQSPEQALTTAGLALSPSEKQQFVSALAGLPGSVADIAFQRKDMEARMDAATKRGTDLGQYTVQLFKTTLDNAAKTYKGISFMNRVMFWVGILLFVGSAIYGAISKETVIAFVFAGLGVATFVALFLTGPIEKTQTALSNLVQAEIGFMNYFEQITFWESVALTPTGMPPSINPDNVERASTMLQKRSRETIDLLQRYLEPKVDVEAAIASPEPPTNAAPTSTDTPLDTAAGRASQPRTAAGSSHQQQGPED